MVPQPQDSPPEAPLGLLGGTGVEAVPGLEAARELTLQTPFGPPSGPVTLGRCGGRAVAFLPRHGPGHRLLPHEIDARANVHALKQLGVRALLSVAAVGALEEHVGGAGVCAQIIDMTSGRPGTFFGAGLVGHMQAARPLCGRQGAAVAAACGVPAALTYLCIDGPRFSTAAEAALWRQWGADVVGMTAAPEVFLAREAEMCATLLVWVTDRDAAATAVAPDGVCAAAVQAAQGASAAARGRLLGAALGALVAAPECACQRLLDRALLRPPPAAAAARLAPLLDRLLAAPRRP